MTVKRVRYTLGGFTAWMYANLPASWHWGTTFDVERGGAGSGELRINRDRHNAPDKSVCFYAEGLADFDDFPERVMPAVQRWLAEQKAAAPA